MKEIEVAFPALLSPSQDDLLQAAGKYLGIPASSIKKVSIFKRSLDARSRNILYRYRLFVYTNEDSVTDDSVPFVFKNISEAEPVIVIGAGPAGLFASLKLIQKGFKPIIVERGKDVRSRKYDIASISSKGLLNEDSNYCFGEGGAGTFSDGKLFTRSNKRGDVNEILRLFVYFGADSKILIDAHPHIGSDKLPLIIEKIRHTIEECGGEYHFGCRVVDICRSGKEWRVDSRRVSSDGLESDISFSSKNVIIAAGHSGKEIYEIFDKNGWALEAKGFALGVRVEHPQMLINDIQYHGRYENGLPPAEYSLVTQVDGRGVFSFCMCPGGLLVPSSTEKQSIVLNGMSNSMRNSQWANAGIVVSIEPEDLLCLHEKINPLSLLRFQEGIERSAFLVSGSMRAPAQRITDFVSSKTGGSLPKSSYFPGTVSAPLQDILPEMVALRLKKAFPLFDKKMKGYYSSEALLLGVESRTSSPVRIVRNPETLQHISLEGIYPCGEGAGYAGGIVSSALDGIACACKIADLD